jgi:hypothetical protein
MTLIGIPRMRTTLPAISHIHIDIFEIFSGPQMFVARILAQFCSKK